MCRVSHTGTLESRSYPSPYLVGVEGETRTGDEGEREKERASKIAEEVEEGAAAATAGGGGRKRRDKRGMRERVRGPRAAAGRARALVLGMWYHCLSQSQAHRTTGTLCYTRLNISAARVSWPGRRGTNASRVRLSFRTYRTLRPAT